MVVLQFILETFTKANEVLSAMGTGQSQHWFDHSSLSSILSTLAGEWQMVISRSNELMSKKSDSSQSAGVRFRSSLFLRSSFSLAVALEPVPD